MENTAQDLPEVIDQVFRELDFCYAYIDDRLIASSTSNEHLSHLRMVLERLK